MSDTEMTTLGRAADSDPLTSGVRARAEFTARGKAFRFPKGQSGNPDGQSRFYHQCRKIAREASPEMMRELIDLAKTAVDERVRSVCLSCPGVSRGAYWPNLGHNACQSSECIS